MKKLLKYDFLYLRKTSKFIVFGAIFVLFSIISPLTARYMEEIIAFFVSGFEIPDPTIYTPYLQYKSDLYEVVFTVTLFVSVSIFIRDKTKDLLPQIFSKPINRSYYILSKYISFLVLLLVCVVLGNIAFTYYTYFLFGEVFISKVLYISLFYFLDLMFICSIALFTSTYFKSYIPAMLVTWGMYIVSGLITVLGNLPEDGIPIIKHFPGSIQSNMEHIIHNISNTGDIVWNIVITSLFIVLFVTLSITKIKKQDI